MVVGSGHFISSANNFPGWVVLFPVLGTVAALLAGGAQPKRGPGIILGCVPLLVLGSLSYSWYLWHWPFLVYGEILFPHISIVGKVFAGVGSLALAAISHRFVENPIRFHPQLVRRPAVSLALGATVTLFTFSASVVTMKFASRLANEPNMKLITATLDDNPISMRMRQQCLNTDQSSNVKTCTFGDTGSATSIVLFGDSHAMQWFHPLNDIAGVHGWKLTTVFKRRCPAADVRVSPPDTAGCASWRAEAIQKIVEMHPSIVLLGSSTIYLGRRNKRPSRFDVSLDDWRIGTRRTLEMLSLAGLRVVVMRDNPFSSFDIPTCLARSIRNHWYPGSSCSMDKSESLNPAVYEAQLAAASGLPNVHFIDLTDQLCEGNVCPAIQKGMVIYRDSNHLTKKFASTLTPELEAQLLSALNATP
jgi:hypothetical protein